MTETRADFCLPVLRAKRGGNSSIARLDVKSTKHTTTCTTTPSKQKNSSLRSVPTRGGVNDLKQPKYKLMQRNMWCISRRVCIVECTGCLWTSKIFHLYLQQLPAWLAFLGPGKILKAFLICSNPESSWRTSCRLWPLERTHRIGFRVLECSSRPSVVSASKL